jgi:hypothetical protein
MIIDAYQRLWTAVMCLICHTSGLHLHLGLLTMIRLITQLEMFGVEKSYVSFMCHVVVACQRNVGMT